MLLNVGAILSLDTLLLIECDSNPIKKLKKYMNCTSAFFLKVGWSIHACDESSVFTIEIGNSRFIEHDWVLLKGGNFRVTQPLRLRVVEDSDCFPDFFDDEPSSLP